MSFKRRPFQSLSLERNFTARQLSWVAAMVLAVVAVSTIALSVLYGQILEAIAGEEVALYLMPEEIQELSTRLPDLSRLLLFWVLGVGALSGLTAGFMALFMIRRMAGPLYRLKQEMIRISEGDLPESIALRDGDEFGSLARALEDALQGVRRTHVGMGDHLEALSAFDEKLSDQHAWRQEFERFDIAALHDERDRAMVMEWLKGAQQNLGLLPKE